jgi:hypothetical protein
MSGAGAPQGVLDRTSGHASMVASTDQEIAERYSCHVAQDL